MGTQRGSYYSPLCWHCVTKAHCTDSAQKSRKMMSKSWLNFIFSSISTCKALNLQKEPTVQIWKYLSKSLEYLIFGGFLCLSLPEIADLRGFGNIRLATGSRHYSTTQLNTLYQWHDLFWPFLALRATQSWSIFDVV